MAGPAAPRRGLHRPMRAPSSLGDFTLAQLVTDRSSPAHQAENALEIRCETAENLFPASKRLMSTALTLQSFVDDQISRLAMSVEKAVDDALATMIKPPDTMPDKDRALAIDVAVVLRPLRRKAVEAYIESLRQQAQAIRTGRSPASGAGATPAPVTKKSFSLVAETAVSSDVVLSHFVLEVKATAESELREISALCASLAGDAQVVREHTPFGAECQGRAIWAAAQVLHEGGGLREGFVKFVARPFAKEYRASLAEACTRLEEAGVEGAGYGALVIGRGAAGAAPPATGGAQRGKDAFGAGQRQDIPAASAPAAAPTPSAGADPQYLDLVGRIFDHFLADRDLPADVRLAISHLVSPAIRLATVDNTLLDNKEHPIWRFIDRIAWQVQLLPGPAHNERRAAFRFVETLIGQVSSQGGADARVFDFALGSLEAAERQRFEDRRRAHAARLAEIEEDEFATTRPVSLAAAGDASFEGADIATAPGALLESVGRADSRRRDVGWIDRLKPADAARIVLDKEWQQVQLLWIASDRSRMFWADCRSEKGWPISAAALQSLAREGLAAALMPKAHLKAAARAVASQLGS